MEAQQLQTAYQQNQNNAMRKMHKVIYHAQSETLQNVKRWQ